MPALTHLPSTRRGRPLAGAGAVDRDAYHIQLGALRRGGVPFRATGTGEGLGNPSHCQDHGEGERREDTASETA